MTTTVNIYRNRGEWCYSMFIGGEYDHSDTLDVSDSDTEESALKEAREMFPNATVKKASDTNER